MSKKLTHCEFLERFNKLEKSKEFIVIDPYNGQQEPINFMHTSPNCVKPNTPFLATPNNMMKPNYGCPHCANEKRAATKRKNGGVTLEKFQEVLDSHNEGYYTIIPGQVYENNKKKINVVCNRCGLIFGISYVNACKGKGCRDCNRINILSSKGTVAITNYLESKGYEYTTEVEEPGCEYIKQLRFDFKVKFGDEFVYIEYDGEQHFKTYRNDISELHETQKRDKAKNEFCEKNGLKLLRIGYESYNSIDSILDSYFSTFKDQRSVVKTYA